jgi:glycosyltransferase involved in cell wall biosynthesis
LDRGGFPVPTSDKISYWELRLPPRFFLFVGVLRYYKGLHTLIEAASISGYPIVIAGSGPEEATLKEQAAKSGLTNVIFVGKVSDEDKVVLLTRCIATVFPSHLRSEAFGISLVESAMYSKPMICCEIGTGTTYINVDQLTGFVVSPENPAALADAMVKMWEDSHSRDAMGHSAFIRYTELFTAKNMAKRYVELYQTLLNRE